MFAANTAAHRRLITRLVMNVSECSDESTPSEGDMVDDADAGTRGIWTRSVTEAIRARGIHSRMSGHVIFYSLDSIEG